MYRVYIELTLSTQSEDSAKNTLSQLAMYLGLWYTSTNTLGHNSEENMFRLFIDIPLDTPDVEEAVVQGKQIMDLFLSGENFTEEISSYGVTRINYRLGNDTDRQKANYFVINENNHASAKKSTINVVEVKTEESSE